eukprot:CAMPEP_0179453578 /NCGR_PEP_ID=MMETSP0799-20121207/37545_1 /TAXON_ID=46947 /ORGANISM="Geminigera cryophila, Strain CCMP2564" /LENGTH=109 /DNA_ID=CAMNT_0021250803 /DNA_START=388 /DNA_END=713 /DNA_ORIENTATION=-
MSCVQWVTLVTSGAEQWYAAIHGVPGSWKRVPEPLRRCSCVLTSHCSEPRFVSAWACSAAAGSSVARNRAEASGIKFLAAVLKVDNSILCAWNPSIESSLSPRRTCTPT